MPTVPLHPPSSDIKLTDPSSGALPSGQSALLGRPHNQLCPPALPSSFISLTEGSEFTLGSLSSPPTCCGKDPIQGAGPDKAREIYRVSKVWALQPQSTFSALC